MTLTLLVLWYLEIHIISKYSNIPGQLGQKKLNYIDAYDYGPPNAKQSIGNGQ